MQLPRTNPRTRSRRGHEHGIVIVLVAVFMLFVIGAMAALSIDVVTLYTAHSEAQLAADAAALAAARVLANSGATSDGTSALLTGATPLAQAIAIQVAESSIVGGRYLVAGEVTVSFASTIGGLCNPPFNPCVSVRVQRTDLPTFFARIWGSTQVAVAATAIAEAYNPSPSSSTTVGGTTVPVAPVCVKPWLLPNLDPTSPGGTAPIFDPLTGAIPSTSTLLGWSFSPATAQMNSVCGAGGTCTFPLTPSASNYFPADDLPPFQHPTNSLPTCTPALTTNYQESMAGCIQTPVSCNVAASIDMSTYPTRNSDTTDAVNCLTHTAATGGGDTLTSTYPPSAPFQFVAGINNPITGLSGSSMMVSDSLVTVPVFDVSPGDFDPAVPTAQIIGFVQLFLNPNGMETFPIGSINATVVNLAGCGTSAAGQPILGNGASPVAVRLISQQP